MFEPIKHQIKDTASHTAGQAGLGIAAGLLLAVGIGFLTLSAWLILLTLTTPIQSALILAGAFIGLSLILFAAISLRAKSHSRRAVLRARHAKEAVVQTPASTTGALLGAFLSGMAAGSKSRL